MKKNIVSGVLLIAALTVGSYSASFAGSGKRFNCDRDCDCIMAEQPQKGTGFLRRMARDLKLTEEQRLQVKSIITADLEKSAPLREKMLAVRKQLHEAATAEKFDEAAVKTIAAKKAEIEMELTVARAKTRNSINAILTPEQRAKAEKMRPKGRQGRGMMPPPEEMP